jgi:hypothetical protein
LIGAGKFAHYAGVMLPEDIIQIVTGAKSERQTMLPK